MADWALHTKESYKIRDKPESYYLTSFNNILWAFISLGTLMLKPIKQEWTLLFCKDNYGLFKCLKMQIIGLCLDILLYK